MTPKQFTAALESLGLSQRRSAKIFGINERQVRRYVAGDAEIPEPLAKLIRLMIRRGIGPEEIS